VPRESSVLVRLRLLGQGQFVAGTHQAAQGLQGIERAGHGVNAGLTAAGAAMRAVGAVAATVGVAAGVVGAKYNDMQDRQRVAFTAMTGSATEARRIMREITRLAAASPTLDPTNAGQSVQRMMAYGFTADRAIKATKLIGNAAAASGKTVEEAMGPAALALGQIQSKGRLSAEELNQLAESVAVGRGAVAKQLGLSGVEFEKALAGGKISARRGINAVFAAIQEGAGNGAQMMARTTSGRLDRLKEVVSSRLAAFQRPFYNQAGVLFGRIAAAAQNIDARGIGQRVNAVMQGVMSGAGGGVRRGDFGAQQVGAGLRGALSGAVDFIRGVVPQVRAVIGQVLDALRPAMPFVRNVLLPLLKGIAEGVLGGVVGAFRVLVPVLGVGARILGAVGRAAAPLRPVFEGVGVVLGIVFGPALLGRAIGLVGTLAGAIGGKLGFALRVAEGALRLMRVPLRVAQAGFNLVTRAVGVVASALGRGIVWVQRFAGTLSGGLRRAILGVTNFLRSLGGRIADAARSVWTAAGRIGQAIVNGIVDMIRRAPGAIGGAIESVVPGPLKGVLGSLFGGGGGDVAGPGTGGRRVRAGGMRQRATGGIVGVGETTIVGERGPELARFPAGTSITPNHAVAAAASARMTHVLQNHIYLDSREIHASVANRERHLAESEWSVA
jgi:tape measure domain-containing protein